MISGNGNDISKKWSMQPTISKVRKQPDIQEIVPKKKQYWKYVFGGIIMGWGHRDHH